MKLFLQVLTAIAAIAVGTVGALAVQSEADSVISAMQCATDACSALKAAVSQLTPKDWDTLDNKVVDDFKRLIDSVEALTDDVDPFAKPLSGEPEETKVMQALTVFFKANRDLMNVFMYDSRFTYAHVLAGQIIEEFRRYQAAAMNFGMKMVWLVPAQREKALEELKRMADSLSQTMFEYEHSRGYRFLTLPSPPKSTAL